MKILYNPPVPSGSPIGKGYNNFVVDGSVIDSLLPGEIKQYQDSEANQILETFEFIEAVTPQRAQELLEKPREKELKCEKCDFSTDTKIALISHQKKHDKEEALKVNLAGIPVAKTKKLEQAPDGNPLVNPSSPETSTSELDNIPTGIDKDNVEWYGEGVREHRESMAATTQFNKGRFGGQPLTE